MKTKRFTTNRMEVGGINTSFSSEEDFGSRKGKTLP
jgi:hypothetical protein